MVFVMEADMEHGKSTVVGTVDCGAKVHRTVNVSCSH